jgi:hypothetical protein
MSAPAEGLCTESKEVYRSVGIYWHSKDCAERCNQIQNIYSSYRVRFEMQWSEQRKKSGLEMKGTMVQGQGKCWAQNISTT